MITAEKMRETASNSIHSKAHRQLIFLEEEIQMAANKGEYEYLYLGILYAQNYKKLTDAGFKIDNTVNHGACARISWEE